MAKKKWKQSGAPMMSPEKYITTRARKLPLGKTYICWKGIESGACTIIVTRVHAGGTITAGIYLIDLYCLGVKDTVYLFSITPEDFEERVLSSGLDYEEADYVEAHNIIYGALEYAEEGGIEPHADFKVSEYILEPDDDNIPLMDFEFGHDGVRELVISPDLKEKKFIPVLEKNVPGKYVVTGCYDGDFGEYPDLGFTYTATMGNDDPDSLNFDYHPFPHEPYPEDLEDVAHEELLDIFYPLEDEEPLDMTLDAFQIATIRAIPREELLSDLRVIAGFEVKEAEDEIENFGAYNDVGSYVMYHVCAILAETGGADTADLAKMMLQQSYHWQDAYLRDHGLEIMHSVLANAYVDNPEELARMVVEQRYCAASRAAMLYALGGMALWHPSVRGRIENELHDLAELILHGDGSELPLLNGFVMGTLSFVMSGLKMEGDMPLIKEMYDRGLVDEEMYGKYDDRTAQMEGPDWIGTRYTKLEQIYADFG